MAITKLYKQPYYNPNFVYINNNEYQLGNIIIYDGDKEIAKTDWFDEPIFALDSEIKLRRKLNFTRNENFIIKSESDEPRLSYEKPKYTLYIYYKNVDVTYEGVKVDSVNHVHKYYKIVDSLGNIHKIKQFIKTIDGKIYEIKRNILTTLDKFKDKMYYDCPLTSDDLEKSFNEIRELNNKLVDELKTVEKTKQGIENGTIKV